MDARMFVTLNGKSTLPPSPSPAPPPHSPLSPLLFFHMSIYFFIQYFARNWPWYSLRGLHIRITWISLYGIRIPLFSLYGIHMPLFPYMVILPIVLGVALLWAAMDSPLSQGSLLWRHNDMTVIVSPDARGRERDTRQRLDNANARRLYTFNRWILCKIKCDLLHISAK